MLESIMSALRRIRERLSGKAEQAYKERDAADSESHEESYAAGEAHAYGISADEVRKEQESEE